MDVLYDASRNRSTFCRVSNLTRTRAPYVPHDTPHTLAGAHAHAHTVLMDRTQKRKPTLPRRSGHRIPRAATSPTASTAATPPSSWSRARTATLTATFKTKPRYWTSSPSPSPIERLNLNLPSHVNRLGAMYAVDSKPDFILMYAVCGCAVVRVCACACVCVRLCGCAASACANVRNAVYDACRTGDIPAHAMPTWALQNQTITQFTSMIRQVFPTTLVLPLLGTWPPPTRGTRDTHGTTRHTRHTRHTLRHTAWHAT
jgi:hypothetical protein